MKTYVRAKRWRTFQYIALMPEPTSSHVPGSGTSLGRPPPHTSPFFLPLPVGVSAETASSAEPLAVGLEIGAQTFGSGAGLSGIHVPPAIGSYMPKGKAGP